MAQRKSFEEKWIATANDADWLKVIEEQLKYNGRVSNSMRRRFLKEVKSNPNNLKLARAKFGENGVYRASARDVERFVNQEIFTGKIVSKGGESKNAR